jgi:hypothetical protein
MRKKNNKIRNKITNGISKIDCDIVYLNEWIDKRLIIIRKGKINVLRSVIVRLDAFFIVTYQNKCYSVTSVELKGQ